MKPTTAGAALLLAVLVWPQWSMRADGEKLFTARLTAMPISAAYGGGAGAVTAVLTGTRLSLTGTFEGLPSTATAARLHRGAKGVRGPAVVDLKVSGGTSGTMTGAIELSTAQLEDVDKGSFYVQLHTEKVPSGHLWGWLLPQKGRR